MIVRTDRSDSDVGELFAVGGIEVRAVGFGADA